MPAPLTPANVAAVHKLRATGLTVLEIAGIVRLPFAVVRNLLAGPTWPKVVTRIHDDGSWEIVRTP